MQDSKNGPSENILDKPDTGGDEGKTINKD